jgi:HEAT repeat protein
MERMRKLMEDRHTPVRREALLYLTRKNDPAAQAFIAQTFGTNDSAQRPYLDLAIHSALNLNQKEYLPQIRSLAQDRDLTIRIAALYVLGQWQDQPSKPLFEQASQDEDPAIKNAGAMALQSLTKNNSTQR